MTFAEYQYKCRQRGWKFNVVVNTDIQNIEYIYPTKQKQVVDIVEYVKNIPEVESVIIFGSSISGDCHEQSDLDLCIKWNIDCVDKEGIFVPVTDKVIRNIKILTGFNCDIVHFNYLDGAYIKDSVYNGIVVYERRACDVSNVE